MAQIYVNFNRYTVGGLSSPDWSWRQANGAGAAAAIASGPNALVTSATGAGTKVLSFTPVDNISDIEVLVKFKLASAVGKQGIVSLRYGGNVEANTTGYALSGSVISGAGTLAVDEGMTGYAGWTAWNYLANVVYWARYRIIGNHIQAKVWTDGSAEPGAWMLDFTNTVQAIGYYSGVHQYNTGNITYYHLSYGTLGDTAPNIPPAQTLAIDNAAHSQIADSPTETVVVITPVVAANVGYGGFGGAIVGGSYYGSSPVLLVKNVLVTADNSILSSTSDNIALLQDYKLTVQDAIQSQTSGVPNLTEAKTLAIQDSTQLVVSDIPILIEAKLLAIDSSLQQLTSDNLSLISEIVASGNPAYQAITSDNLALVQQQALSVDNSAHAITSPIVSVTTQSWMVINDATHAHSADAVVLAQVHSLLIDASLLSMLSGGPILDQKQILQIANAFQAQYVDAFTGGMAGSLAIQDSYMAMASTQITVSIYAKIKPLTPGVTIIRPRVDIDSDINVIILAKPASARTGAGNSQVVATAGAARPAGQTPDPILVSANIVSHRALGAVKNKPIRADIPFGPAKSTGYVSIDADALLDADGPYDSGVLSPPVMFVGQVKADKVKPVMTVASR